MSNTTYEEIVDMARSDFVNYLNVEKEIQALQNELKILNVKPEHKEQREGEIIDLKEYQKGFAVKIKHEHQVDVPQLLAEGKTNFTVMGEIRKSIEKKYTKPEEKKLAPSNPDHPRERQKELPVSTWATDPKKVAKDQKEQDEQKKPATDQKPITEQTFTVTHPKGEVPQSAYEDMYRQQPAKHQHPRNRGKII